MRQEVMTPWPFLVAAAMLMSAWTIPAAPSTPSLEWTPYTNASHDTMVFDVNSECKTAYDEAFENLLLASLPD